MFCFLISCCFVLLVAGDGDELTVEPINLVAVVGREAVFSCRARSEHKQSLQLQWRRRALSHLLYSNVIPAGIRTFRPFDVSVPGARTFRFQNVSPPGRRLFCLSVFGFHLLHRLTCLLSSPSIVFSVVFAVRLFLLSFAIFTGQNVSGVKRFGSKTSRLLAKGIWIATSKERNVRNLSQLMASQIGGLGTAWRRWTMMVVEDWMWS